MGELAERDGQLAALGEAASAGHGVLVLLGGEAGSGKTALLRRFAAGRPRVLWGSCDPLFTPRPLGPFADMARGTGGELLELVDGGARAYRIADALVRASEAAPGTIIVVEDVHWADEATLDVLSLLGRRIETIPALVVVTYRDDELDRFHPLRRLLGETATARRLSVPPLSAAAVAGLAEPYGVDAAELHRTTGGNPFFVTEVLATPEERIPATVRDAVMARASRLSPEATAALEEIAIGLTPDDPGEALNSGIVEDGPGGVAFRHELARQAIEQSLTPSRRVALHRRALETPGDPATLAHHAEAAGDTAAVLRFAPAAARRAASSGAHREAAAQYARALRFGGALPAEERAELLERRSYECYLTDQMDASIDALEQAVELWRATGDHVRRGAAMSQLSRELWCLGRTSDSNRIGGEALRLLEAQPPGPELADACSVLAATHMNAERFEQTVTWAERALRDPDPTVQVHSLNNLGTMQLLTGRPEGWDNLSRSLELAEAAGLDDHIGRAYIHLGWAMTRTRAYHLAPWLDRGLEACRKLGLEAWEYYVVVYRARFHLDSGRTGEAVEDAEYVLRSARSVPLLRLLALTVLGLARARRGDPHRWSALDEALTLAKGQTELQYLAPVATARAEAAWLDGRTSTDENDTFALAVKRDARWVSGELAWLRRLAGGPEIKIKTVSPYARQLAGEQRAAATEWTRLGCPYDAALALAGSDDEGDLRRALSEFQRLGAKPAAAIVSRRLRALGVRDVPRGPRAETARHPASLTRREAEVLAFLRRGEPDAEIAARLHLSEKTVHHHVSAILRKMGVANRREAASEATRRGLITS
ncbi:LuxR C-terminal-related transcriptional regulator [Actinoplanes bogorensis]|uniref:LuxR C-terminal-related transcriptional regulator n=1 Tax=Paractinoplanes bogorensis TaxID=1610840 RepID=A0ABS5YXN1_9ACTN|nr:helix-turn-helix transcriptional regulator [Actinoplanes bogorensis]MBU2668199.1 LuxR C-terminal-related transcriptional regulator [Actinoplanes bogorensis]